MHVRFSLAVGFGMVHCRWTYGKSNVWGRNVSEKALMDRVLGGAAPVFFF